MKKNITIPEGYCTAGDLAKRLQIGTARITQLKKRGVLKADRNNLYNIEESKQAMKSLINETQQRGLRAAEQSAERGAGGRSTSGSGTGATPGSFADSLARKEAAKAQLAEMDVRVRKNELVEVAELKPKLIKVFTDVKTRIRAIAPKVAQAIAHIKLSGKSEREQIAEIQKLLSREHDEALEEVANWRL